MVRFAILTALLAACGPEKVPDTDPTSTTEASSSTIGAPTTSTSSSSTGGDVVPTTGTASSVTVTSTSATTLDETTVDPGACMLDAVRDCCCLERVGDLVDEFCPFVELCSLVVFCPDEQQGDCPVELIEIEDPEDLGCILDSLAGNVPGQVAWAITPAQGSGWVQNRIVYPIGDGTALVIAIDFFEGNSFYHDTVRVKLADSQYFTDCKQLPAEQGFDCLQKGLGAVTETCIAGFDFVWNG